MGWILSIYFNTDRTYLTLVREGPKGLALEYINSTENPILLENPDSDTSILGFRELDKYLKDIKSNVNRVAVTLPSENVLVTQFTSESEEELDELTKIVDKEIRNIYPQFTYQNFTSSIVPLGFEPNGLRNMMAIIISKQDFESCKKFLQNYNLAVDIVEISQLNAHSAFIYNYPEHLTKNVAIVGIQNQFIDLSIIKNTQPSYYNLLNFQNKEEIPFVCDNELGIIQNKFDILVEEIFLFGIGLNKQILNETDELLRKKDIKVSRMNAFRMMSTFLSNREREYCQRTAHLYPPCIGACINPYHKRYKIY